VDEENTCYGGRTHRSHLVSKRIIMFQSSCSVKLGHDPILQVLQTLSDDKKKCSSNFFKDEEILQNVVVEEFLADGGESSLKKFLDEFPEAA
jgi:ribosomal 50S subunit-associated protein YjgA (DUF615 family)